MEFSGYPDSNTELSAKSAGWASILNDPFWGASGQGWGTDFNNNAYVSAFINPYADPRGILYEPPSGNFSFGAGGGTAPGGGMGSVGGAPGAVMSEQVLLPSSTPGWMSQVPLEGVGSGLGTGLPGAPLGVEDIIGSAGDAAGPWYKRVPWGDIGDMAASYGKASADQRNQQAELAQRDRQQLLSLISNLYENQEDRFQRQGELGFNYQQQVPLRHEWRERQSMMGDILPGLRNYEVTLPGDMARFQPTTTGGLRLPEQGFSQDTLALFSPAARMAAEQDLDRQAQLATQGRYNTPDYGAYYGQSGVGARDAMNAYGDTLEAQAAGRYGTQRDQLNKLLEESLKAGKKGTGEKVAGAAGGAITGAQIGGSILPGWGHAIGAIGGGLWGLFS